MAPDPEPSSRHIDDAALTELRDRLSRMRLLAVIGRVTGRFEREWVGANVLGDLRVALPWRANELSRHGIRFAAA